ncbi:tRNA lysidine(34) synthetase TilS [Paraburkholderia sp. BCC1886]|uniref:tRNA lysidine(34) synthetase TilS n=1 Tax=Paraburkholderia sp. BCC1886 TaxID=2562670 RepID=UPI0011833CBC|nr:tRNA lysidine(34) synthetase TilS [Paraburkholderia sp. BCC1886]
MTSTPESSIDRLVLDAVDVALRARPESARVAIALSGGVDSSVLLDAAVRVAGAARCVALHVHHGLSRHADAWLVHCEALAQASGVEFDARRVAVSRAAGHSVEASARDARYRALDEMCAAHGVSTLWLAQHADDQAETVLLQLLRGAGLAGLAAMAPVHLPRGSSESAAAVRVRPLLHLLRAQLERYASERGLHWIDDESNADTRYARNALRHEVTPALAVHFPGFRDALMRTAAHAAAAQRLLEELARIDMEAMSRDADEALVLDDLLSLDDERALNLLRYWMRTLGLLAASSARLNDALRQLREVGASGEGHRLRVDHDGRALRCYRGLVYWEAGDSSEAADETALIDRPVSELVWQGEAVWHLPQWRGTFMFVAATEGDAAAVVPASVLRRATLSARARSGGERMRPGAALATPLVSPLISPSESRSASPSVSRNRTLKNLFQERGIPAWKRDVPLLYVGAELLYVPGLGVNRTALPDRTDPSEPLVGIDWRDDLVLA